MIDREFVDHVDSAITDAEKAVTVEAIRLLRAAESAGLDDIRVATVIRVALESVATTYKIESDMSNYVRLSKE